MSILKQPSADADLRQRVITCLHKLSDRDTLSLATAELESIAKTLPSESFSPFLTCLSTAVDSSHKSPVRTQCVRLLGLLSVAHGDDLSSNLPKMISAVLLRRLRDSDSSVRSACVEAASSMATHITSSPFSSFLKPLTDSIFHEQDLNSMVGASLCLAAAIAASPDPQPPELCKLLPKLLKMVRRKDFPKAKPALLSLIGSIIGIDGASNRNVLSTLIPCLVEYLSNDDWAARRAAAESLETMAGADSDLLPEFKSTCLANLENRKFDKVKVVRETMNRALEMWKLVPGNSDEALSSSHQSQSSTKDADSQRTRYSLSVCKGTNEIGSATPQPSKSRSSPSINSSARATQRRIPPLKSPFRKPTASRFSEDIRNPSEWRIEISVPRSSKEECEDDLESKICAASYPADSENCRTARPETKRALFSKIYDEKLHKFSVSKSGSRVVPFQEVDSSELDVAEGIGTEDVYESHKEVEDISLIRRKLVQIEHQQSSLLDLLQRFIGSSQLGMTSLETRVNGLEKVLDEMSHDLAISAGRVSTDKVSGNSCCMLAGTEFLSPKFWRRTEGQNSRLFYSWKDSSLISMHNMPDRDANSEIYQLNSSTVQLQSSGVSAACPSSYSHGELMEMLESHTSRTARKPLGADRMQVYCAGGLDGTSHVTRVQHQT